MWWIELRNWLQRCPRNLQAISDWNFLQKNSCFCWRKMFNHKDCFIHEKVFKLIILSTLLWRNPTLFPLYCDVCTINNLWVSGCDSNAFLIVPSTSHPLPSTLSLSVVCLSLSLSSYRPAYLLYSHSKALVLLWLWSRPEESGGRGGSLVFPAKYSLFRSRNFKDNLDMWVKTSFACAL